MAKKKAYVKKKKNRLSQEKRNLIMGIVIIALMATSAFGVIFYGFSDNASHSSFYEEGIRFSYNEAGYEAKVNKQEHIFAVLPSETQNIIYDDAATIAFQNTGVIYIISERNTSFDGELSLSKLRLYETATTLGKAALPGFIGEAVGQKQNVSCQTAQLGELVIELREGEENKVTAQTNSCIMITYNTVADLSRGVERLRYGILGVFDEE